jgi:hypothetical protein
LNVPNYSNFLQSANDLLKRLSASFDDHSDAYHDDDHGDGYAAKPAAPTTRPPIVWFPSDPDCGTDQLGGDLDRMRLCF